MSLKTAAVLAFERTVLGHESEHSTILHALFKKSDTVGDTKTALFSTDE